MLTVGRVQKSPHDFLVQACWWTSSRPECFVQYYLPEHDCWLTSRMIEEGDLTEEELSSGEDSPFVFQLPLEQRVVNEGLVKHPEMQVVALLQALLEGRAGGVSSGGIDIAHMEEVSSHQDEDGVHNTVYRVGLWGPHWGVALERAGRYSAAFIGF